MAQRLYRKGIVKDVKAKAIVRLVQAAGEYGLKRGVFQFKKHTDPPHNRQNQVFCSDNEVILYLEYLKKSKLAVQSQCWTPVLHSS